MHRDRKRTTAVLPRRAIVGYHTAVWSTPPRIMGGTRGKLTRNVRVMESVNVSVVVPCYNAERTFPCCLDSLLAQTADNFEVICVNDGSRDGTLDLIRTAVDAHPGFIRYVDQENAGLWNARWSGTDVARGEYVAYLDSDDYVDETFVQAFLDTAREADADIVVCGFKRIDEETQEVLSVEMDDARPPFRPLDDPGELISINSAAWNKMFKRSLLLSMHRLDNPPQILEDVTLSQLAYLATKGTVAFTGSAPYRYMIHADSMINTITSPQIESIRRALLEIREHFLAEVPESKLLEAFETTVFLHMGIAIPFRVSASDQMDLGRELALTTEYLDRWFPLWKTSRYMKAGYALKHRGAFIKLFIASRFYKWHLMRPFLALYRFVVERLHIEIKW